MSSFFPFHVHQALGPADLAAAADAFEQALSSLNEGGDAASRMEPHAARQKLADHIMNSLLSGERDTVKLRDGALRSLRPAGAPRSLRWTMQHAVG